MPPIDDAAPNQPENIMLKRAALLGFFAVVDDGNSIGSFEAGWGGGCYRRRVTRDIPPLLSEIYVGCGSLGAITGGLLRGVAASVTVVRSAAERWGRWVGYVCGRLGRGGGDGLWLTAGRRL